MSAPWIHTDIRCLDMDIGSVKFKIQEVAVICHLVLSEKDYPEKQRPTILISFKLDKVQPQGVLLDNAIVKSSHSPLMICAWGRR